MAVHKYFTYVPQISGDHLAQGGCTLSFVLRIHSYASCGTAYYKCTNLKRIFIETGSFHRVQCINKGDLKDKIMRKARLDNLQLFSKQVKVSFIIENSIHIQTHTHIEL